MNGNNDFILAEIKNKIYSIRGFQVILDNDLAALYNVETKQLNRAVKRNIQRFPEDFCFQLTKLEYENLKCQNGTSSEYGGKRYLPYVFTEQGVAILSGILNSEKAIKINILIIRAFIVMRKVLKSNYFFEQKLDLIQNKQLKFEIKTEEKFDKIFDLLENNEIKKSQGIFYNGEMFDSHVFISSLIKSAKTEIILIDNYIDENTLLLFNKRINGIKLIIYTNNINKNLKQDLEKYNSQYEQIEIKEFNLSHDRFLIIDKNEIYHVGASLKDLGKKWFAFSKLDKENLNLLDKLK